MNGGQVVSLQEKNPGGHCSLPLADCIMVFMEETT